MSRGNFNFLSDQHELFLLASQAELNLYSDPHATKIKLRVFAETMLREIAHAEQLSLDTKYDRQLRRIEASGILTSEVTQAFRQLQYVGNHSAHQYDDSIETARKLLVDAHLLANWFYQKYDNPRHSMKPYQLPPYSEQASKEDLEAINKKMELKLAELQSALERVRLSNRTIEPQPPVVIQPRTKSAAPYVTLASIAIVIIIGWVIFKYSSSDQHPSLPVGGQAVQQDAIPTIDTPTTPNPKQVNNSASGRQETNTPTLPTDQDEDQSESSASAEADPPSDTPSPEPSSTDDNAAETPIPSESSSESPSESSSESPLESPSDITPELQPTPSERVDWDSALFNAAKSNDVPRMQTAINGGADINASQYSPGFPDYTPLMIALFYKNTEAVQYLLQAGADPNLGNSKTTPISLATFFAPEQIVLLGKYDADPEVKYDGYPLLVYAASRNESEAVSSLLAIGANPDAREDRDGDTALMEAARNSGSLPTIQMLIKAGADASLKNYNGNTAYQLAKSRSSISDITTYLANYDPEGQKELAEKNRLAATLKMFQGAKAGDASIIKEAVRNGADVDVHYRDSGLQYDSLYGNQTAIEIAVSNDNLEAVRALLELGATPNPKTNYPLIYVSATRENAKMIDLLASYGANVNAKTSDDNVAIVRTVQFQTLEVLRALIRAGADVNARGWNGNTALIQAVERAKNGNDDGLEMVTDLVRAGADPELKNFDGKSALFLAKSYPKIMEAMGQ